MSDIVFHRVRPFSACGIARVEMKDENGIYPAYFDGKELKRFENTDGYTWAEVISEDGVYVILDKIFLDCI